MIEVVAAVIVFESRILAFQRGDSKYSYVANKFEFPGGKMRKDEPREDSLIRELREELDLDIKVGEWITTFRIEGHPTKFLVCAGTWCIIVPSTLSKIIE